MAVVRSFNLHIKKKRQQTKPSKCDFLQFVCNYQASLSLSLTYCMPMSQTPYFEYVRLYLFWNECKYKIRFLTISMLLRFILQIFWTIRWLDIIYFVASLLSIVIIVNYILNLIRCIAIHNNGLDLYLWHQTWWS